MAETTFGVTYDGSALAAGRIPVEDLAPSLLALGAMFKRASAIVYPDKDPVGLSIKATADGSFDVLLVLHGSDVWDKIVDLFSSSSVEAIVNIKELLIGSGTVLSLFALIKKLFGKRIVQREAVGADVIKLTLSDGTVLEVPARVLELYEDGDIRTSARKVIEPLTRKGVDSLEFHYDSKTTITVGAGDVPAFELPEVEEVILEERELTIHVSIASVAFTDGNKWRLSTGGETFYAAIEDDAFLARVNDGQEAFRKGDTLRCRMGFVQRDSANGLSTEWHVIEVLEHLPRSPQLRIGNADAQ